MIIRFIRQVRQEFVKISWPNKKKTLASTAMVFVMILIMSLYFFLVDWGLSSLVNLLLNLG